MNAGASGDGLLRGMFEGSISGHDTGIQRRPYHKNCGCALHKSRGHCNHSLKYVHVSYPIRRSWSEGCLALAAAAATAASHSPSPGCSPSAVVASANDNIARRRNSSMIFSIEEEEHYGDDANIGSGKV